MYRVVRDPKIKMNYYNKIQAYQTLNSIYLLPNTLAKQLL